MVVGSGSASFACGSVRLVSGSASFKLAICDIHVQVLTRRVRIRRCQWQETRLGTGSRPCSRRPGKSMVKLPVLALLRLALELGAEFLEEEDGLVRHVRQLATQNLPRRDDVDALAAGAEQIDRATLAFSTRSPVS